MSVTITPYFTPTSITGCRLWLDAADSSTITVSGSNVTNVADKSGNGTVLSNATGFTYPNSSFNGSYPSFLCSSGGIGQANNAARLGYNSAFAQTTPFTVFFVSHQTQPSAYGYIMDSQSGSGRQYTYNNTLSTPFGGSATDITSTPSVVSMTWIAGTSVLYHNGTSNYSGSLGSFTTGGIIVGNRFSINESWPGHICELIYYSGQLGTTQRQQVEGYLAQKWGLTSSLSAGHPGLGTTIYRSDFTKRNIMRAIPYYVAFSPRQIGGCLLWLDGADSSTVTGTSPITAWTDKSGNGRTVTITSGPTYGTTTRNGLKTMYFNNNVISSSIASAVGTGDFTLIAVWYQSSAGTNTVLSLGTVASSSQSLGYSGNKYNFYQYGSLESAYNTTPTWVVQIGTRISSIKRLYITGNIGSVPASDSFNVSDTTVTIGKGDNFAITGEIAEIMVYTGTMSDISRQLLESYLAQKWGLTASLPGGHSHLTQPAGAITRTALTNLRTLSLPRRYVSFRWTITAGNTESLIQFSEFQVGFNGTQLVFASPTTATTGSSISWNTGAGEGPAQAVDNNLNTKGLGIGTSGLVLIVTVATPIAANMYRWATANDVTPGRNPTQWTVDGSVDGATYVRLHTQNTAYSTPSSTFTFTSWIPFT
jgi:hypothetical protein